MLSYRPVGDPTGLVTFKGSGSPGEIGAASVLACSPCFTVSQSFVKFKELAFTLASVENPFNEYDNGGSIVAIDATVTISNCHFTSTVAQGSGGAVFFSYSSTGVIGPLSMTLSSNKFENVTAKNGGGGAVYGYLATPIPVEMTDNIFKNALAPSINSAASVGGAVAIYQGYPRSYDNGEIKVTNNLIINSYGCAYNQMCNTSSFYITHESSQPNFNGVENPRVDVSCKERVFGDYSAPYLLCSKFRGYPSDACTKVYDALSLFPLHNDTIDCSDYDFQPPG